MLINIGSLVVVGAFVVVSSIQNVFFPIELKFSQSNFANEQLTNETITSIVSKKKEQHLICDEFSGQWQGVYVDEKNPIVRYSFILDSITCYPSSFDYFDSTWNYDIKGILRVNGKNFVYSGSFSNNSLFAGAYEEIQNAKGFFFEVGNLKKRQGKDSQTYTLTLEGQAHDLNNSSEIFPRAKYGKYILSKTITRSPSMKILSPIKDRYFNCEDLEGNWQGVYYDFLKPDSNYTFTIDSVHCEKKRFIKKDSAWDYSFVGSIKRKRQNAGFFGFLRHNTFGGAIYHDYEIHSSDGLSFKSDQIKIEVSEDSVNRFLVISGYGRGPKHFNDTSKFFPGATFGKFILSKKIK